MYLKSKRSFLTTGLALGTIIFGFTTVGYLQMPAKTSLLFWKTRHITTMDKNNTYFYNISSDSTTVNNIRCYSTTLLNESAGANECQDATLYVTLNALNYFGLGNQMFKYASLLGIARAQGRQLFIQPGSELQNTFKLHHVTDNKTAKRWPVIGNTNDLSFDENLTNLPCKDIAISGYLQSYKYFHSARDEVRQEYIFHDSIATQAAEILHDLHAKYRGSLFIGVHVRRGDFLLEKYKRLGYRAPKTSYFLKAFDWMKSKFSGRNITFLVASNDAKWCKENLKGENIISLPTASAGVHMAALSRCDHVIITGGTFGWWSGWLAGGYVIYYKDYLQKGSLFGDLQVAADYYPRLWVGFED